MKLSITISTFENRFEKFLVPLVNSLVEQNTEDYEIMVVVNGNLNRPFTQEYRERILSFCSSKKNVYPVMYPTFRGLAKLWNTGVVNSTGDYVLIMNDDVSVQGNFIADVCKHIDTHQSTFTINSSYSHFVVKRSEIDDVGYFDERLLGVGEEDGDFAWRYIQKFGREIPWFSVPGVGNYVDQSKDPSVRTHSGTKYSLFNRVFTYDYKYKRSDNATIRGFFDYPMVCTLPTEKQYPYENFYLKNKGQI